MPRHVFHINMLMTKQSLLSISLRHALKSVVLYVMDNNEILQRKEQTMGNKVKYRISIVLANRIGSVVEGDPEFDSEYFMGEMTQQMEQWLKDRGFYISQETKEFHFNSELLDEIETVVQAIIAEYQTDDEHPTWEQFGIDDDDAVDYNGGYIMSMLNVAKTYLKSSASWQSVDDLKQIVCTGDDVECKTTDAVHLMLSHLSHSDGVKFEHPLLRKAPTAGLADAYLELTTKISNAMIEAGLAEILKIDKQFINRNKGKISNR